MKSWFLAVLMAAVALALAPSLAEAKRFGGGFSKGMQRSAPAKPPPQTPPSQAPSQGAAAGTAAAGTAAAAAGKRSWMGPIAGLAAGLGIAALFSAMGLGEELANFVMIALLVLAAVMAWRFFARRASGTGPRLATAGPGLESNASARGQDVSARSAFQPRHEPAQPLAEPALERASTDAGPAAAPAAFTGIRIGAGLNGGAATGAAPVLPADFDREAFERIAKMIFIRMQAANDAADVEDLRAFTTPELFADLRLDLQERGPAPQHTDVQEVRAEVLDFAEEDGRQIVSVHYQGRLTEADGEPPVEFDEVWHLVRPADASRNWAIAGIQQQQQH